MTVGKVTYYLRQISALLLLMHGELYFSAPVQAGACAHEKYRLNRIALRYEICDNGAITLSYERPSDPLKHHGIRSGSRLFTGRENTDGTISGTMWVYKKGCGRMGFIVRGTMSNGQITLTGRVPVRDRRCDVVRTRGQKFTIEIAPE